MVEPYAVIFFYPAPVAFLAITNYSCNMCSIPPAHRGGLNLYFNEIWIRSLRSRGTQIPILLKSSNAYLLVIIVKGCFPPLYWDITLDFLGHLVKWLSCLVIISHRPPVVILRKCYHWNTHEGTYFYNLHRAKSCIYLLTNCSHLQQKYPPTSARFAVGPTMGFQSQCSP